MALFRRGKQSGRERRAMKDHLVELDQLRRKQLSELGALTVEMADQVTAQMHQLGVSKPLVVID